MSISILLKLVQGPLPSNANTSVYGDLFPSTSWPIFEVFFKSSLVVIFMALAAQVSLYSTFLNSFNPEIERIMYSLQFMFADTITPLIVDYRTKRSVSPTTRGTIFNESLVTKTMPHPSE
jgi:hypothetical protein